MPGFHKSLETTTVEGTTRTDIKSHDSLHPSKIPKQESYYYLPPKEMVIIYTFLACRASESFLGCTTSLAYFVMPFHTLILRYQLSVSSHGYYTLNRKGYEWTSDP